MIKINILRIFVPCLSILSSTFCSDIFVTPNGTNINRSAISYCMCRNTGAFLRDEFLLKISNFPNKYSALINFPEHITTIDLNSTYIDDTSTLYFTLGLCRSFVIMHEFTCILFDKILHERLPDKCKKLLNGNIKELKKKCDRKSAQKLSVLTAINTSWEDALSAMKEIVKGSAFTHDFSLTEALFILHLKPSQHCNNNNNNNNSIWNSFSKLFPKNNEYKEEDVLFYAECITGALARVLKYEKKIPSNFEFDIIQTNDLSWCFLKNVKKLIQAYTNYFINEKK